MPSDSVSLFQELFNSFPALRGRVVQSVSSISYGHINRSYKVGTESGLIFVQQINDQVFGEVEKLSIQINQVSQTLSSYYERAALSYENLLFFETTDHRHYLESNGAFYRVTDFKGHLKTMQVPTSLGMVMSAAEAFAHFVRGLDSLPLANAYLPIPRFHDLGYRYQQLKSAIAHYKEELTPVSGLLKDAEALYDLLQPMHNAISEGVIPLRWVHNDTKLNNLLFDEHQNAKCVIDLDTVMPGSILFDLGDALRTICSNLPEDDAAIDSLRIEREYLQTFTNTYLETLGDVITEAELKMVPYCAIYMSTIMGFRFLADHLNGDIYYNVDFRGQNLNRAKNQLGLAKELSRVMLNSDL